MRVFIIRHGESEDDVEDCYGGIADFALTPLGRDQASEVAKKLAAVGIEAIYSSPLARAHETATIVAAGIPTPKRLRVVEELQERNSYGVLSGVNKARASVLFQRVLATLKEKPGYSTEPLTGSEPWSDFVARVRSAFATVVDDAQAAGYDTIAVVTHGKFSQALFRDVLHLEGPIDLKLSAINELAFTPQKAALDQHS